MAVGSLGVVAGYAVARLLHRQRPLLVAALSGTITSGITYFFLNRYIKAHPEVQKRETVLNCLLGIKPLDPTGNLVLKPKAVRLKLNDYIHQNNTMPGEDKSKIEEKVVTLEKILEKEETNNVPYNKPPANPEQDKTYEKQKIVEKTIKGGITAKILEGHTSLVTCLKVAEGKVFTSSEDGIVKIWDLETGICLHTLIGHKHEICCLVVEKIVHRI